MTAIKYDTYSDKTMSELKTWLPALALLVSVVISFTKSQSDIKSNADDIATLPNAVETQKLITRIVILESQVASQSKFIAEKASNKDFEQSNKIQEGMLKSIVRISEQTNKNSTSVETVKAQFASYEKLLGNQASLLQQILEHLVKIDPTGR